MHCMITVMIPRRNSQGNMTYLMVLTIGVLVLIVLGGFVFNTMLSRRSQAEYAADSLALALATQINSGNRVGQMNKLQEASRELVLVSRQNVDKCIDRNGCLSGLCSQLLEESVSGHELLEKERKNEIAIISDEVSSSIKEYNRKAREPRKFFFLGFEMQNPEILRVDLGRIAGVSSNVRALDAIPELADLDIRKSYVDTKSKLYKADINAKLSPPDEDLDFNFCSLPAFVGTTAAPPRNTNADMFVSYGTIFDVEKPQIATIKQIPSAVQIYCRMNMTAPWERQSTNALELRATGSASGASPDFQ
ncbi:MAG TPA: pilus assembly protein TadG-related protein [Oculatellaceae cyanobacterium]